MILKLPHLLLKELVLFFVCFAGDQTYSVSYNPRDQIAMEVAFNPYEGNKYFVRINIDIKVLT